MTFWHGTTIENARKIQAEGLKPIPEQRLQVMHLGLGATLDELESYTRADTYVYLTPDPALAEAYANFRASYANASKGQIIHVPGLSTWKKLAHKTNSSNASPALVKIELTDEQIEAKLKADEGDYREAYRFAGAISPEFIKEVISL